MSELSSDESKTLCPNCGTELDPGVAQGLCPRCALAGVGAETENAASRTGHLFEPPPIERIATAFPNLEIIELIGRGGMGAVYKARQPHLDRMIALKILPESLAELPEFTERFTREARLLAKLNHPNIVTVHDFGQAGGFFFLIMELIDGVNLREAMRAGRFTPQQALEVTPKICEALQFAHEEGVLHRDIKPENILVDTKGRVKIADFGIAKLIGESAAAGQALTGSLTPGTPQYMAPEQIEHPAEVDHRADIYSLGVVFYEMLTGELPLGRFAPPSERSAVDSQVDEIVFRALAKERDRRQQSAGEVKTEIEAATLARERHPAYRSPGARSGRCVRQSKSLVWPATLALMLVAVVSMLGIFVGSLVSALETARVTNIAYYQKLIKEVGGDQEGIRRYHQDLSERSKEARKRSAVSAEVGAMIGIALFLLGTIPGVFLGWRTLHRHRLSGESNPFVAIASGLAALLLPILVLDVLIIFVFLKQDLALVVMLVVDAALIWLVWKWMKTPPPEEARVRYLAKVAAAAGEPVNPWPRRIFWLILVVLMTPCFLMGVATLAWEASLLPRADHSATLSLESDSEEPQEQPQYGGMLSPLVHANAKQDPSNRFEAILTLYSGHLMTFGVEIETPDGVRHPISAMDAWLANGAFNKARDHMIARTIRWETRGGMIRFMEGARDGDRVFNAAKLDSFAAVNWEAVRGDRSFWFGQGEWKTGSTNDFLLFRARAKDGDGNVRMWARIGLHQISPFAEADQLPDTVTSSDKWQKVIEIP